MAFFCKDYFKQLAGGDKATPSMVALSSMASGIVCVTTTYPIDIVRARVTVNPGIYEMGITGVLPSDIIRCFWCDHLGVQEV